MPGTILPHHHENHSDIGNPAHNRDESNVESVKLQLDEMNHFQIIADIFKQLADCSRIRIFWLLCHREECVTNISSLVGMTSPAVSHHLRQLKTSGLIVSRRDGKETYYKAAGTSEACLLHEMIEKMAEISCPQINL